jgi:hypothetical protein
MKRNRYDEALEALDAIASLREDLKTRMRWDSIYGIDIEEERAAIAALADDLREIYSRLLAVYQSVGRKKDEQHPPTLEELRELLR